NPSSISTATRFVHASRSRDAGPARGKLVTTSPLALPIQVRSLALRDGPDRAVDGLGALLPRFAEAAIQPFADGAEVAGFGHVDQLRRAGVEVGGRDLLEQPRAELCDAAR